MFAKVDQLREEHARLAAIVTEISKLLEPGNPNVTAVSALRWKLCRELMAHLAAEDRILYPRLLAHGDAAVAATASTFIEEMGGLGGTFKSYMEKWTFQRISSEWTEFCRQSSSILEALVTRIRKENAVLYPLAERVVEG